MPRPDFREGRPDLPSGIPAGTRPDLLFAGLSLMLLILAVGLVILPLAGLIGGQMEAIRLAESRLAGQERLLQRAGGLEAERTALQAAATGDSLLQGESDGQAAGSLQARLIQAVQAAGAQRVSTQALEPLPDPAGGFSRIPAVLVIKATPDQLRNLLHDLESGRPHLVVRSLSLRPADPAGGRLDVVLEVFGLRAAAEGS